METLHTIAKRARFRLQLVLCMQSCTKLWAVLCFLVFLLAVVDRLGVAPFVAWDVTWIALAIIAIGVFAVQWYRKSLSQLEAASEVDYRMHLRDRISSAIACEKSEGDPFYAALLQDALSIVEKEKVQEKLPQSFPITFPKELNLVVVLVIAALLVQWSPQWGLWNSQSNKLEPVAVVASRENIEQSIESILEQLGADETLSNSLEDELKELAATSADDIGDPESLRREALRKITDLQKRLDELLQEGDAMTFEEMSRRMQALELPSESDTLPLVAAMKNGDFSHM